MNFKKYMGVVTLLCGFGVNSVLACDKQLVLQFQGGSVQGKPLIPTEVTVSGCEDIGTFSLPVRMNKFVQGLVPGAIRIEGRRIDLTLGLDTTSIFVAPGTNQFLFNSPGIAENVSLTIFSVRN